MGNCCLFQERLDALLPFGKTEIIKWEESSLYPTPCVFTPTIYFLDLKEKPSRYSAEAGQNALKEAKGKRIQRFENQYWSPFFNSQTCSANGVTLCERTREWRPTVPAWQLYRKSHMLKCYSFFPLHLAFLPQSWLNLPSLSQNVWGYFELQIEQRKRSGEAIHWFVNRWKCLQGLTCFFVSIYIKW